MCSTFFLLPHKCRIFTEYIDSDIEYYLCAHEICAHNRTRAVDVIGPKIFLLINNEWLVEYCDALYVSASVPESKRLLLQKLLHVADSILMPSNILRRSNN